METHAPLRAAITALPADVPADVKTGLINLLEQFGPAALALAVRALEAAKPEWTPVLEALKTALTALIGSLGSGA